MQALGSARLDFVLHADCGRAVQRYEADSLDVAVHLSVRAGVTGVRVRGWGCVTPADFASGSAV